jgi:hypothetical protein
LTDPEFSTFELVAVILLEGFGCRRLVSELDKSKASRPSGVPIQRQKDLVDVASFGEDRFQLVLSGVVTEVSNEEF